MKSIIKRILKESVTKMDRFINYIVNDLKDKTNSNGELVFSNWRGNVGSNRVLNLFGRIDPHDGIPGSVDIYLLDTYQIDNFDIQKEIWRRYINWYVSHMVDKSEELNESRNKWAKLHKFQDYIVDDLINKTTSVYDENDTEPLIITPFNDFYRFYKLAFKNENITDRTDFCEYIKNTYGSSKLECKLIWELYRRKVLEKFSDEI